MHKIFPFSLAKNPESENFTGYNSGIIFLTIIITIISLLLLFNILKKTLPTKLFRNRLGIKFCPIFYTHTRLDTFITQTRSSFCN